LLSEFRERRPLKDTFDSAAQLWLSNLKNGFGVTSGDFEKRPSPKPQQDALLAHPSLGSVRRVQHAEPRVSSLEKIPERIGESAV
jgi:hypothetical protein